jgi:hypothetical protein
LVVALVGIITIAGNAVSTALLSNQSSSHEASKDERAFAFGVVQTELAKTQDSAARAETLLFLVRAGILNSLNRDELEKMATHDLQQVGKDPSAIGIPEGLGLGMPSYNLPLPQLVPGQTSAASEMLRLATLEINSGVEENASPASIRKYWEAVPSGSRPGGSIPGPDVAWNLAFISWLIDAAGNPDKLPLSSLTSSLWKGAESKGITFDAKGTQILAGDLIFMARSNDSVERIRSGDPMPGVVGVVWSVEAATTVSPGKITYIAGNVFNAVRLADVKMSEPKIVGFARLGKSTGR